MTAVMNHMGKKRRVDVRSNLIEASQNLYYYTSNLVSINSLGRLEMMLKRNACFILNKHSKNPFGRLPFFPVNDHHQDAATKVTRQKPKVDTSKKNPFSRGYLAPHHRPNARSNSKLPMNLVHMDIKSDP